MGLEIPIAWLTVLLFGSLALLLALGLPMAFCTGSLAVIFLFIFGTPAVLNMMPSRIFPFMTDYQLSAVPLFIFMAAMLEKAGIIEELFDVIYAKFSKRGKAIADIITSVFFFIFIGTMVWTSARFALDSIQFGEHSFTEWGIQYWPVKLTMPIGAAMLLLQGVSRLIKDVLIVTKREA